MALSALQRQAAETLLRAFCEARVPQHARSQVRLEYQVRGNSLLLIERRVPWNDPEGEWTSSSTAKFTFEPQRHIWKLLWRDRNGRFHQFDPVVESARIADLIAVVDEDPTCMFWG